MTCNLQEIGTALRNYGDKVRHSLDFQFSDRIPCNFLLMRLQPREVTCVTAQARSLCGREKHVVSFCCGAGDREVPLFGLDGYSIIYSPLNNSP